MSNIFPIAFVISFFFPGLLEAYAAFRYFKYIHDRGGLAVFIWFAMSAHFDIVFSIATFVYILNGSSRSRGIDWSNPVEIILTVYLTTALYLWRFASGMIALWFSTKITEAPLRKLLGIKEDSQQ
jgi:hypothetical protein